MIKTCYLLASVVTAVFALTAFLSLFISQTPAESFTILTNATFAAFGLTFIFGVIHTFKET